MAHHRKDHKIAISLIILVFLVTFGTPLALYAKKHYAKPKNTTTETDQSKNDLNASSNKSTPASFLVADSTKQKIAEAPPKHSNTGSSASVKTNSDGSTSVTVPESGAGTGDIPQITTLGPGGSSPENIRFSDETGNNSAIESILRDYTDAHLLWSDEVPYLYEIIIRNAGDTGWEGQYCGSYKTDSSGNITSAFGYIILNTYYHQNDPQFNDYMKLVLSHEYGHHYTLWHKWMDYNLPVSVRFPDSYYTTRPLSKESTATDYSLGWGNSESEIIAEDYSYVFSGYGYDAVAKTYGYPSAAMRAWFVDFPRALNQTPPLTDNLPTISITSPADGATLLGTFQVSANASDDHGISKVQFFIDGNDIGSIASAPYQISFGSASYPNGSHTIKATVTDIVNQTTDSTISVTFNNNPVDSVAPTVGFTAPTASPYSWDSSVQSLLLQASATDDVAVTKMEFYINETLVASGNNGSIAGTWAYSNVGPGTYTITSKAYDDAGNVGQASLTINKS